MQTYFLLDFNFQKENGISVSQFRIKRPFAINMLEAVSRLYRLTGYMHDRDEIGSDE